MMRRALLALTLCAPLAGCFFSLDGSLVDKKRDAGARELSSDARPKDHRLESAPGEGSVLDRTTGDQFTPKVDHRPQGG